MHYSDNLLLILRIPMLFIINLVTMKVELPTYIKSVAVWFIFKLYMKEGLYLVRKQQNVTKNSINWLFSCFITL